jgi:hypothetical protein
MSITRRQKARRAVVAFAIILSLLANFSGFPGAPAQAQRTNSCPSSGSFEGTMFAVTVRNTLLNFNPGTPGVINSARFITGLASGESIVGIDFRPADEQLYAISSASRVYMVNPLNGQATPVGTAVFNPALSGQSFGVDFNPVPDRIRLVSDAGQNLRLNPNNGAIAGTDTTLMYDPADVNANAAPKIVGAAYTNNFAGTTNTTLYGIDSNLDVLVTQGSLGGSPVSPNTGRLFTVGKLNVDAGDMIGFDITPVTNAAFASLTPQGMSQSALYTINLATGAATSVGLIGGGQQIRDIAFAVRAENVFAVTSRNHLIRFNAGMPGLIESSRAISGLADGESIVGLDFRPANGDLYAVTTASRVFTINPANGVATRVRTAPFTPALNGISFGVDFNPLPDRIRVVSEAEQNLRLNPNTGAVAGTDTPLTYAAGDVNEGRDPNVVAAAYTNSFAGATSTTLYVIDSEANILATQGSINGAPVSPNSGRLFTVGSLGIDPTHITGLDISSESGVALACVNAPGLPTRLYTISLSSGTATMIGPIAGNETITDIAIEARVPTIYAITESNVLVTFDAGAPDTITSARAISGIPGSEVVLGLDFRPATGQLFALTSASRLYILNPLTATAAPFAVLTTPLNGTDFGFDFNPVPDRIRVVSDTDQNLRLNPNNGALAAADGTIAFATGIGNADLVGAAYTNSYLGATTTSLYAIDRTTGSLVTQGSIGGAPVSPNTGQLFPVGSLGVQTTGRVGFDIAPMSNAAFASLTAPGGDNSSRLFAVNLVTGAATLIGAIGVGGPVRGITVGSPVRATRFDLCLQDDRTGDILQFNSCTGDYQFLRCGTGGFMAIGRAEVDRAGNLLLLRDAKLAASVDMRPIASRNQGQAIYRPTAFGTSFSINDSGTTNNTCTCR